jgi:hypothetical protein
MVSNTLYYLFSTLAQTFGAIVGLIGILTVYRLQQLNTRLEKIWEPNIPVIAEAIGGDADGITPFNLPLLWEHTKHRVTQEGGSLDESHLATNAVILKTEPLITSIHTSKDRFIVFLVLNLSTILLSLLLIPFCEIIDNSGWKYFWTIVLLFMAASSLFFTMRLCFILIETSILEVWKRAKDNFKNHRKNLKDIIRNRID